jgi:hypothetical protein
MIRIHKLTFLLIFTSITCPLLANAESCQHITNMINQDLARYADTIKTKQLPWMDFAWLKQQLGAADAKSISESGTLYQWRCGSNGGYLIAVVDQDGSVRKVRGEYNSDQGSGLFSSRVPKFQPTTKMISEKKKTETNNVEAKPTAVESPPPPPNHQSSVSDRVHQYNDHYKTSFNNSAEIENDMLHKIKHYYSSLRECKAGTYEFPIPVLQDFLYNIATISPQKDNHCRVKVSYTIPQIGNIDLKCNYPQQSLQLYTDAEAEVTARGITKTDPEQKGGLQAIVEKECKRYIDGVL